MQAILTKSDFVHKQVKPLPAKAHEQKQLEFEQLIEQLPQDTLVYFTDATHPTHNTQTAKAWIRKGQENTFRPIQVEKGLISMAPLTL